MNRIERWWLKRLIKREVKQDLHHALRIRQLYQLIREVCEQEFYEDNYTTLDSFLQEQFTKSQSVPTQRAMNYVLGLYYPPHK